ncbi:MAG: hypothetical protein ABI573_05245 [Chloroflexota bacterium]
MIVAMGLGTGVYAFSLATVTALQAATDRQLIADRAPVGEAIDLLGTNHDQLTQNLEAARARYVVAADGYSAIAGGLEELHGRLDQLAAALGDMESFVIDSRTLALLDAKPTKSGSGISHTSGSGSGTTTKPAGGSGGTVTVAPPPPPVAPPTTQGTTGASGAP